MDSDSAGEANDLDEDQAAAETTLGSSWMVMQETMADLRNIPSRSAAAATAAAGCNGPWSSVL